MRKGPPSKRRRPHRGRPRQAADTAWEKQGDWYHKTVGAEGHYYHRQVIFPFLKSRLSLQPGDSVLDLACGQGVLRGLLGKETPYVGVDAAPRLIQFAKKNYREPQTQFYCADVSQPLPPQIPRDFSHATLILCLQDIEEAHQTLKVASHHLKEGGRLFLVINHPAFRIARQSSWGIDETHKIQYRRLNRYLSPLKVPLQVHPSKGERSETMWAFHRPLTYYFEGLERAGFQVEHLSELISDRLSRGPKAKMENRARKEFPLFLALIAVKTRLSDSR